MNTNIFAIKERIELKEWRSFVAISPLKPLGEQRQEKPYGSRIIRIKNLLIRAICENSRSEIAHAQCLIHKRLEKKTCQRFITPEA